MISLGFNISKGHLHFTVLEGQKPNAQFRDNGRLSFDAEMHPQDLSAWFEKNFHELLNKYNPDRVGYRTSTDTTKDVQLIYMVFPWGILNLLCHRLGIECRFLTSRKFTHRLFNTTRPFDKSKFIDDTIGQHPPNWNDAQRLSALASLASLDD